MNARPRRLFGMWLEFFLIFALGSGLWRVLIEAVMVPFARDVAGDASRVLSIGSIVLWIGTICICYFAFRYVVGKSLPPKDALSDGNI